MSLGFFGVLGFDKRFQVGEVHLPEATVLFEPRINGAEWIGIELVDAVTAFAVFPNQVGPAQESQMFGNRRTRHRECLSNFAGGLAASPQQIQNGTPGRVGKGLERRFR